MARCLQASRYAASPADNPLTPEKIALGARLFSDPRLSGAGRHSCASCHRPTLAFTDGRRQARALSGEALRRNTPALWNLAWSKQFFWDGRAPSLETQVRMPIEAAEEMGGDWPAILQRLAADDGVVAPVSDRLSHAARHFAGHGRQGARLLCALARFAADPVRRLDRRRRGRCAPPRAARLRLFAGKAGCVLCHVGWRFTDDRFHDIGLRSNDAGRGAVPDGTPGRRAFKTPSLRERRAHGALHARRFAADAARPCVRHYTGGFVVAALAGARTSTASCD